MIRFAGPPQPILRKVDLQVVPNDACRNWWTKDETVLVTANQICAYGMPASASGVCNGDSGNQPRTLYLVVLKCPPVLTILGSSLDYRDPLTGRYYAIGITSWGFDPCSTAEFPNVFADVTKYVDWIDFKAGELVVVPVNCTFASAYFGVVNRNTFLWLRKH